MRVVGTEDEAGGGRLVCEARASAAPAEYRVGFEDGRVWVSLVTGDRWLSHSIEADLLHTGDKIEELLEEELVEQGLEIGSLGYQHYRSEDKLYTFRSALPVALGGSGSEDEGAAAAAAAAAAKALLAYEACFRHLGDMDARDEG